MGACSLKKKYKDKNLVVDRSIFDDQNNLINMGLGEIKMNYDDFCKLYNKMLEPLKLTAIAMHNAGTNTLDHYYKSNNTKTSGALKNQIKKIQSELKLLHKQKFFALNDCSRSLPIELSNSIFIRQASSDQNFLKALISGSDNTPYANGLFLYDIFLPENYPSQCPKMQLITTGGNSIRFNPNLYSSGYVCLSLLGTWRGDSVESWNPAKSNLLQVLLSIQSLVMSEGVYYNEPSHENDYKTTLGKQRNVGYSNIVRYATVKYAINEMIQNPPKGFEETVKLHFTIKSNFIMKNLDEWVENAKRDNSSAVYDGLVSSHNYSLAEEFKKNSSAYQNKLKTEVDIAKNLLTNLVQSLVSKDSQIFLKNVQEESEKKKDQQEQSENQENEDKKQDQEIIQEENEKESNSNNKEEDKENNSLKTITEKKSLEQLEIEGQSMEIQLFYQKSAFEKKSKAQSEKILNCSF